MSQRTVRFVSAGLTLSGTFGTPGRPHPVPAALLLPGSGPADRDDSTPKLAINAFPPLVDALESAGWASLRYDKRGVGASEGDPWRTGFDDRLTDAAAALAWLGAQPEVDPARLVVLGHSEGALLAVRLAAGGAPVAGLVLLAGSAKSGEQTLLWQGDQITRTLTGLNRWLIRLLRIDPGKQQRKYLDRIKSTNVDTMRIALVQKVNAKWLREFMAYDPAGDLPAIGSPVLAVTGDKDLQVDPDDLQRMAELIPGDVETHRVPDLTHLLRADPGPPSLRTYRRQVRQPVDPRVVSYVRRWLARFG